MQTVNYQTNRVHSSQSVESGRTAIPDCNRPRHPGPADLTESVTPKSETSFILHPSAFRLPPSAFILPPSPFRLPPSAFPQETNSPGGPRELPGAFVRHLR